MHRPPRTRTHWLLAVLIALVCGGALSFSTWSNTPNWSNADSLFYQSMSLELDGHSAQAARATVFGSPLARPAIRQEPSVADPRWQSFESQFSRRRWLVPMLTAAVRPIAGERALPDVAIIGYLLFGVALFLLLASRFAMASSIGTVALCLALGPVREWGLRPMTDSWGLFLSVMAILSISVVMARGRRWLPLWIAIMLALSFTRDLAIIPLAGLVGLMLADRDQTRRRPALILACAGVLATIPAYLLFGASLRLTLAFQINGFEIPSAAHATWSYVAAHYPSLFFGTVKADVRYAASHPVVGLTIAIGLLALFTIPARRDTLILLMRGAAFGWLILFALDPDFSGFRYELTILPSVAVGLCSLAEYAVRWFGRQASAQQKINPLTASPDG
jgi:hypothetical protein